MCQVKKGSPQEQVFRFPMQTPSKVAFRFAKEGSAVPANRTSCMFTTEVLVDKLQEVALLAHWYSTFLPTLHCCPPVDNAAGLPACLQRAHSDCLFAILCGMQQCTNIRTYSPWAKQAFSSGGTGTCACFQEYGLACKAAQWLYSRMLFTASSAALCPCRVVSHCNSCLHR